MPVAPLVLSNQPQLTKSIVLIQHYLTKANNRLQILYEINQSLYWYTTEASMCHVICFSDLIVTRYNLVVTRYDLVVTRYYLLVMRNDLIVTRYNLVVTRYDLVVTRCDLVVTRYELLVTRCTSYLVTMR